MAQNNPFGDLNGNVLLNIPKTSVNSSGDTTEIGTNHNDEARLISSGTKKRGWRNFSSHERCAYVSLGVVSALAIAFMAATAVLSFQLKNDNDAGFPTLPPTTTLLPPGLTFAPITTTTTTTTTTTLSPSRNTCITPECALASGKMLRSLSSNSTFGPCDDFYEYACGGWLDEYLASGDTSDRDQLSILGNQLSIQIKTIMESEMDEDLEPQLLAQEFYHACVNRVVPQNYDDLLAFIDFLVNDNEGLGTALGKIRRYLGGNFIFKMNIDVDAAQTENTTIYINQPTFGLDKTYLTNPDHPLTLAYNKLIQKTWVEIYYSDSSQEIAYQIVEFESTLAQISAGDQDEMNEESLYNPKLINQLYNYTEKIDWEEYFTELYAFPQAPFMETLPSNWNETSVVVRDVKYLFQLGSILLLHEEQVIRNFLKWRIILTLINDVSTPQLQAIFFEFSSAQGVLVPTPKWKTCADQTNSYFSMAISYFFAEKYFSEEHKANMNAIVQDVKDAFTANLLEMDWMSENSSLIADLKLVNLTTFVAYPEWLLLNVSDPDVLNSTEFTLLDYYEDLVLSNSTNHFTNVLDLIEWHSETELVRFGMSADSRRWILEPTTTNVQYSGVHNSLTIPVGFLQSPFYASAAQYLNYGAIAAIIAHELTHGFDERGRQSDPEGNINNWWDEETLYNFTEKAECFIDQYDNYYSSETGRHLNGTRTLSENIADNGGLSLALKAYRAYVSRNGAEKILPGFDALGYTDEQLFYLSYAQSLCSIYQPTHLAEQIEIGTRSPNRFRVRGVVENSIEFAQAWSCPNEPSLNETCQLW